MYLNESIGNKKNNKEFTEIFQILCTGAKEKKISVEEMDTTCLWDDQDELQAILEKTRK